MEDATASKKPSDNLREAREFLERKLKSDEANIARWKNLANEQQKQTDLKEEELRTLRTRIDVLLK